MENSLFSKFGLDEKEQIDIALNLMKNKKWLYENYDKLREKYLNKYIAVDNEKIIDIDDDFNHLIENLKKKHGKFYQVVIELITPHDIKYLL